MATQISDKFKTIGKIISHREGAYPFQNFYLEPQELVDEDLQFLDKVSITIGKGFDKPDREPWADALADKHGVSMSAVAARYVLDQYQVSAVIIGARYAHHLPQTLSIFELFLDPDDYAELEAVLAQRHGPSGYVFELESDRTGRHGSIMKYNLNELPLIFHSERP